MCVCFPHARVIKYLPCKVVALVYTWICVTQCMQKYVHTEKTTKHVHVFEWNPEMRMYLEITVYENIALLSLNVQMDLFAVLSWKWATSAGCTYVQRSEAVGATGFFRRRYRSLCVRACLCEKVSERWENSHGTFLSWKSERLSNISVALPLPTKLHTHRAGWLIRAERWRNHLRSPPHTISTQVIWSVYYDSHECF